MKDEHNLFNACTTKTSLSPFNEKSGLQEREINSQARPSKNDNFRVSLKKFPGDISPPWNLLSFTRQKDMD